MKKLLFLLAFALLLSACGQAPASTTESTTQPNTTAPEPTGLYDPESLLEQQTGDGIAVQHLDANAVNRTNFIFRQFFYLHSWNLFGRVLRQWPTEKFFQGLPVDCLIAENILAFLMA